MTRSALRAPDRICPPRTTGRPPTRDDDDDDECDNDGEEEAAVNTPSWENGGDGGGDGDGDSDGDDTMGEAEGRERVTKTGQAIWATSERGSSERRNSRPGTAIAGVPASIVTDAPSTGLRSVGCEVSGASLADLTGGKTVD
ncbi:hypothetical protein DRE_04065 [Drechslerella stenobrocha 248]|uniref:Uncharacterized protein n=1 Tax=Drechslerella stenobrocha 248 TaxID=1043628 RepID=W7I341_9PEZI|nr:hypothetical protein DRE_04065 [Drechslerella stenobrocha 248]